ncbi:hypothetical protein [Streptomyces lavendulae]|uniref:hypothetical protein n=1 Tax=Streptomyces lavendulae TaxID=1914 RepID=UPI0036E1847F
MDDIQPADIRALRQQGDIGAYLRQQIAAGRARKTTPPPDPSPPEPGHVPGTWPAGSQPPQPIPAPPPGAWDDALHRYRTGTQTGTRCECPACAPRTGSHPDAA